VPARAEAIITLTVEGSASSPQDWDNLGKLGFSGEAGQSVMIPGDGILRILVGLGDRTQLDTKTMRLAGAAIARCAAKLTRVAIDYPDELTERIDPRDGGQALAEGLVLGSYSFDAYRTSADSSPKLVETTVVSRLGRELAAGIKRGHTIAEATCFARDLVNEPGGQFPPAAFARAVSERAMSAGLSVTVMEERAIEKAKLGGLLGVNRGSTNPPRFVRLTYAASGAKHTLALVGKGITFDSGGLSLKPADSMMTMKCDKGGAAAVAAAMCALPALKAKVNVEGYIPLTDNMPGPDATRPGDVLTARNGTTIEVLNTDAEGRLILADALALASEAKPDAIIDLATLTGACMVALGDGIAGVMANDDQWAKQVLNAGDLAGEGLWRLPLPERYRKLIDSSVADVKNIGGKYAGALTAGLFLKEFVDPEIPWVHMDIAGPAWSEESAGETPKGGTGFGVRTLLRTIERFSPPSR
jgi:leucyl aminopeptidase